MGRGESGMGVPEHREVGESIVRDRLDSWVGWIYSEAVEDTKGVCERKKGCEKGRGGGSDAIPATSQSRGKDERYHV